MRKILLLVILNNKHKEFFMKQRSFLKTVCGIMLVLAFSGCAGKPAVNGDQLDAAIRETSNYLNANLSKGNKLAILNIQSVFPALSEYIIDELTANTVNDRVFTVVDRQQLDAIRAELNFQMSGEVDDDSAQELGRMLGAQIIISGGISKIGNLYRLRIRALGVEKAQIIGQFNRNIPEDFTITALLESDATGYGGGSGAASSKPARAAAAPAGQAPAPAAAEAPAAKAPANGTYTFIPRLRAFSGARAVNVYLYRAVVRNGYVTLYLQDVPTETVRFGWDFIGLKLLGRWGQNNTVLKDLDNPSRVYYFVENSDHVNAGFCTFQNVTGTKFSLTTANDTAGNPPIVFDEIILGKPDSAGN
jgi:hypothetical protein